MGEGKGAGLVGVAAHDSFHAGDAVDAFCVGCHGWVVHVCGQITGFDAHVIDSLGLSGGGLVLGVAWAVVLVVVVVWWWGEGVEAC